VISAHDVTCKHSSHFGPRPARFDHCAHASVTARALWSRRTSYGHSMHVSITAHTLGAVDTAGPAALAAQLTRRARLSGLRSGRRRGRWTWRVEQPVAIKTSVAQAGDSRASSTSTARGWNPGHRPGDSARGYQPLRSRRAQCRSRRSRLLQLLSPGLAGGTNCQSAAFTLLLCRTIHSGFCLIWIASLVAAQNS
jgi:hypothetical protein